MRECEFLKGASMRSIRTFLARQLMHSAQARMELAEKIAPWIRGSNDEC
jgi:hypothetical protein